MIAANATIDTNIDGDFECRWWAQDFVPLQQAPSTSCVKITPDVSHSYTHDDPLPEARSMLNLIQLPDGTVLGLNGAGTGKYSLLPFPWLSADYHVLFRHGGLR